MNPNKLTPDKNLLWESSRMMLPEHKERLIQHREHLTKQQRDEQGLETIIRALRVAMFNEKEAIVTVWSDFELENNDSYAWISFDNVLNLEIVEEAYF